MEYNVENLITVSDYAKTLVKYNPAEENSMIRADDYAASLKEEYIAYKASSLITISDYINSLYNEEAQEEFEAQEMEANLEEYLSIITEEAKNDAHTLEELLAE